MAPKKGAISFGLVYIPVDIYKATQNNDISFNQLVKDKNGELTRVKYMKTCPSCNEEIKNDDIVKGFQYEKNKYVVVTNDDFEKIKTKKDKSINILQFSDQDSVPSLYLDKSYYLISQKGGEKPFELLRQAMIENNKVAIGQTVLGTKETVMMLKPEDDGILMQTLYYEDEIKEIPDSPSKSKDVEINETEKEMANQLVENMSAKFDPAAFKDEYQEKLTQLIEAKIEGKEITAPEESGGGNVIDLMDALQASLKGKNSQTDENENSSDKKTSKGRKKTKSSKSKSETKRRKTG